VSGKIRCPVCHGAKQMTLVVADVMGKKTVKRTCVACGGRGRVPFIDRRKTESQPETMEGEGWGKHRKWKKAHYFVSGKGLCGTTGSYQGPYWKDVDDKLKCVYCSRKFNKQRDEG